MDNKELNYLLMMSICVWFGFAFGFLFVCGGGII